MVARWILQTPQIGIRFQKWLSTSGPEGSGIQVQDDGVQITALDKRQYHHSRITGLVIDNLRSYSIQKEKQSYLLDESAEKRHNGDILCVTL